MKIYIAGKITGNENYREKFAKAQAELEKDGHIVLNPAVMPEGMTKSEYMKLCFAMIDIADEVYLLPGWQDSEGARLEEHYCRYIGKFVAEQKEEVTCRECEFCTVVTKCPVARKLIAENMSPDMSCKYGKKVGDN